MNIHKLAYVHPKAELGQNVEIGPFAFIDKNVKIGDGTVVMNSATVKGRTVVGKNNKIYHNAIVGADPQDLTYRGEETSLVVGDNNEIRECVTISRGTKKDEGVTIVGNNNLIMACAHVAHDCIIEDNCIIANSVLFAGHIKVESNANIMGLVGIQPFVTIGQLSYIGGLTRIVQDVPPFMIVEGHPSKVRQVNVIGLRRAGYNDKQVSDIKDAYKRIFRSNTFNRKQELELLENNENSSYEIKILIQFLRNKEKGKHGRFRESLR